MGLQAYLTLDAVIFCLVAFSRFRGDDGGMVFTLFAICITVAEVALGLAIVILLFRTRRTASADHVDWLKG
jgi:NADH-quinone oxidoreductase subunit K